MGTADGARRPDPRLVAAAALVFVDDPAAPRLDPSDVHHLLVVLRLRPGEYVVAADGRGRWVPCRVAAVGSVGRVGPVDPTSVLEVDGPAHEEVRPAPPITVAFAPAKGDRPEWVAQKLTELGVDRIVPITTVRSVVRWEGVRGERAIDRLRRISREAASQARLTWLPEVTDVCGLEGIAEVAGAPACLARPDGQRPTLASPVVAVGPEGGFDPDELARYAPGPSLGPTVLRSETAAVMAGGLLCALRSRVLGALA